MAKTRTASTTGTASYDKAATEGLAPYVAGSAADPQGNTTSFSHDGAGNLMRTQNALAVQNSSRVTRHGIDGVSCPPAHKGQVCASFDARNIATRYTYDSHGQVTKVDHPAPLGDVTMTHDSLGRVTAVTDGKAQTRAFTYDRLDNHATAAYPSKTITYGYDPAGNHHAGRRGRHVGHGLRRGRPAPEDRRPRHPRRLPRALERRLVRLRPRRQPHLAPLCG